MSETKKHIAHFDLDSFFVSVEIRNNPLLKGKPVLVGGYERGVVAACSYEARKFGIHSAMPMKKAMQLCPQAIVTNASRGDYSKYSRWVTEIIASKVPLFEKASIDEFYIDLSGMDKFFGVSQYAKDLRHLITSETGLPISCGIASARFIAKMATNEAKPNGFLEIPHGKETAFLWPLGIEKINGVGKQTEQHLKSYGIYTIEDLAKTPVEHLEKIAGKWGEALWHKAHGIGSTEITTDWEQKSMSHENTFDADYTDVGFLHKELVRLTEKTAYSLREDEKLTGCITVKIRYSDFETTSRQETVDYTALDDVLIAKVKDLFNKSWQKGRPVRLLGVRFSQFIPFTMQMSLFDNNVEKLNLYKAVDDIKVRYGSKLVTKAVVSSPKSNEAE
ncbi:MAG: DNA polymerase IV [Chitinophagaceae bacterium]|nr:DNA polymerase IV [Chitinophagaceae bacterium]MBK7678743.1 DNA polymerase IV [Chitinophagaceae bacterium]MBK8299910.1 DNA polymerase IV [Chitinophagaceae bacterium]MBK9463962.1 DNA polymerase IV [Chitinophagaceae bacterium]MBK9658924.1 DNA polymerase IV [Chitinophagaceae bacterium]